MYGNKERIELWQLGRERVMTRRKQMINAKEAMKEWWQ